MKCEICGKREAVIHIRQVFKNESMELNLCEECAEERGVMGEEETEELSVGNLLTGLVDFKGIASKETEQKTCPRCGLKVEEFKKRGRFGCNECFSSFEREIRSILSKMAGRNHHTGKFPKRLFAYKAMLIDKERMKQELREALDREDYEKAAILRDRIGELDSHA